MATIFTKIIQGEIPSHKVLEDDKFYAFMDIRPINRGHVLVVPKVEVDRFFDLTADVAIQQRLPFLAYGDRQTRIGVVVGRATRRPPPVTSLANAVE